MALRVTFRDADAAAHTKPEKAVQLGQALPLSVRWQAVRRVAAQDRGSKRGLPNTRRRVGIGRCDDRRIQTLSGGRQRPSHRCSSQAYSTSAPHGGSGEHHVPSARGCALHMLRRSLCDPKRRREVLRGLSPAHLKSIGVQNQRRRLHRSLDAPSPLPSRRGEGARLARCAPQRVATRQCSLHCAQNSKRRPDAARATLDTQLLARRLDPRSNRGAAELRRYPAPTRDAARRPPS